MVDGAGSKEPAEKGTRCESGAAPQRYVETNLAFALGIEPGKRRSVDEPATARVHEPEDLPPTEGLPSDPTWNFRGEMPGLSAFAAFMRQPTARANPFDVPVRPRGRRSTRARDRACVRFRSSVSPT